MYLRLTGNEPSGNQASWYLGENIPEVDAVGNEFVQWFESTYYQPGAGEKSAWKAEKMEYQFAASLPKASGGFDVVSAEEYYQGSLDWHSFDLERRVDKFSASLTSSDEDEDRISREKLTVIPTDIRFPGMPNARRFIENHAPAPAEPTQPMANNAKIKWELGNFNIPENWIPFITVHATNVLGRETNLRRGALPRLVPGLTPERIRPRTELLREGLDETPVKAFLIHEEEVPRSGVNLLRTWQRTRWYDGSVYTWLGRRKTTGRGQANSGMRFDQIKEK